MKFIFDGEQALNVAHVTKIYIDNWKIRYVIEHGAHAENCLLKEFRKGTYEERCAAAKEYLNDLIKQLEG